MKLHQLWVVGLLVGVLVNTVVGNSYFDDDEVALDQSDYTDNTLDNLLRAAQQKRACIRRGGNCDHRPKNCCNGASCRCNLWGSNCQCQRMGLFQKWG